MLTCKQKTKTSRLWTILATALFLLIGNVGVSWGQTSLPVSRTVWNSTPAGWTDSPLDSYTSNFACSGNNGAKFDTNGDKKVVFFSDSPDALTFVVKSNSSPTSSKLLVEESVDGVSFSTVVSLSGTSDLPTTCTTKGPYTLNASSRYVRWTFTKGSQNMTMDDVEITKITSTPYLVTFDGNGSTSGSMSDQSIPSLTSANLTANSYIKTGYTFAGWATSAGGAVAYTDGASYTMGTANVTLYAQWIANKTVTFNANGGTGTMANQSAGVPTLLTSNAFTRSGYTFAGWNTVSNGSGTAYADGAYYPFTADETLYAQWDVYVGPVSKTYKLITDISDLEVGKKYLIVNSSATGSKNAMGSQSSNNRNVSSISIVAGTPNQITTIPAAINAGTEAFEFTLGGSTGAWTLYDPTENGYLYAASSGSNYLRTQSSNDANGNWAITFSGSIANIVAQGTNSRKTLQYNASSSGLFSCYSSASQNDVYLYKEDCSTIPTDPTSSFSVGSSCGSSEITFTGTVPSGESYFWQTTATGTETTLPSTTPYSTSTSGTYYLRAQVGTCWSNGSASQAVTVALAPAISPEPANTSVVVGNTATFNVTATNATGYQWQVSTDLGLNWNNVSTGTGATTASYTTVATTTAMNDSRYRVIVSGNSPCTDLNSNGAATLTVSNAIIIAIANQSSIYGSSPSLSVTPTGTVSSWTATLPAGLSINSSGVISGTISEDVVNSPFASSVTANFSAGGSDTKTFTWTITKKALTITGLSGANKIYDGNATASISGTGSLAGIVFSDAVTLSGTPTGTFANKNVGTAKAITVTGYSLTGAKAGNYSLTQPTGITANITSKALTVSGANAQNKPYDGNTSATISGGTLSGVISPDVVTISGGGTFANADAGTGKAVTANLSLGGADAGNYTITQPTGLTANITKATPAFTTSTININVGGTYTLPGANVTSNSTGAFIYTITSNGKATLSGLIITGTAVGTETLTVNQAADANYNAGTTTVTINVTDVANGTFRTTSAGTWPSGSATWEKYTSGSWSAATPSAATTELLIIRHTVTSSNSFSASGGVGTKMRIENGGKFIDGHASTFSLLHVKDGGTFDANASGITFISTATFQVDDNGTVNVNEYASKLWDGVEAFSGLSIFNINKWRISERLFTPEDVISNHSITGAKFGKLYLQPTSFSGTGSNWTGILPSGVYILTNSDFIINNDVTQNFTFDGGDFTVGGNLIANPISSGDIAAQSQTGTKSITVNGNVIKNGTGLFRLNGSGIFTLTVNGDLIINEGTFNSLSVFTASVYSTVDLKGHFTSALGTTVTASISSNRQNPLYLFSGTIDQNVDLKGTNDIYNVQVNKSSGVVNLVTNLTVKEKLTMTLGNVVTNTKLLELGESTTNKGTLSYTSGYVVGNMKRWFNGTSTGADASDLFPFGFDDSGLKNRFAKIQFTGGSPSGALSAFFVGSPMGSNSIPILEANSPSDISFDITSTENQGYWDISVSNGTFSASEKYKATLLGEGFTTITDINKLVLLKRPDASTAWFVPGTLGTGITVTYNSVAIPAVAREGISTFSHFGFGGGIGNPLPVTLTAFNVSCAENNNEMDILWTTASEQNSSHFTIEKSRDLISWTAVSTQEAAGNSNQEIQYKTKDLNASNGVFYYRLIQVDYNGESQIYGPISVSCENDNSTMTVYPNPSKGKFTVDISWSKANADASLQLIDLTGKVINEMDLNLNAGSTQVEFNEANLQMGTYLVRLNSVDGIGLKPVRVVVLGN